MHAAAGCCCRRRRYRMSLPRKSFPRLSPAGSAGTLFRGSPSAFSPGRNHAMPLFVVVRSFRLFPRPIDQSRISPEPSTTYRRSSCGCVPACCPARASRNSWKSDSSFSCFHISVLHFPNLQIILSIIIIILPWPAAVFCILTWILGARGRFFERERIARSDRVIVKMGKGAGKLAEMQPRPVHVAAQYV